MRCPDCRKTIGRFDAANPPRCPRSGRLIVLAARRHAKSELAWWRPVDAERVNLRQPRTAGTPTRMTLRESLSACLWDAGISSRAMMANRWLEQNGHVAPCRGDHDDWVSCIGEDWM